MIFSVNSWILSVNSWILYVNSGYFQLIHGYYQLNQILSINSLLLIVHGYFH